MSKVFALFTIIVSSHGVFAAIREAGTTAGEPMQGQYMTDPSSPSEYMKQQLKNYEESVGISHDHDTHTGSESNAGSASEIAAPVVNGAHKETATFQPLEGLSDSTKQEYLAANERKINQKPSTKEFENSKYGKGSGNSEKQNPGGFAMRISAEVFEINIAKSSTENPSRVENSTMRSGFESAASQLNVAEDPVLELKEPSTDKTEEIDMVESATTVDPVDEEIRKVLDSLPKLPEITFSDNNSHFAFHKDPEEAALDDRITQVARQLAETSIRRQYEEKKLGHYIPIRLRQFDENYPSNSYSSSRKLSTSKTYANPFSIIFEIRQEPQMRFKALPLPQHIYNGPIFIPKDLELSPSSTEGEHMSEAADTAYATETNSKSEMDIKHGFSPAADSANILQLGPRYVLSTSRNAIGNNRVPILFHLTPAQPLQTFYNQNDIDGYEQA